MVTKDTTQHIECQEDFKESASFIFQYRTDKKSRSIR